MRSVTSVSKLEHNLHSISIALCPSRANQRCKLTYCIYFKMPYRKLHLFWTLQHFVIDLAARARFFVRSLPLTYHFHTLLFFWSYNFSLVRSPLQALPPLPPLLGMLQVAKHGAASLYSKFKLFCDIYSVLGTCCKHWKIRENAIFIEKWCMVWSCQCVW